VHLGIEDVADFLRMFARQRYDSGRRFADRGERWANAQLLTLLSFASRVAKLQ
jgi:hypothetical protein